ncbi:MAG: IS66 family insertion sequence element accessory protein TnpA [Planctomyces sp.]
MGRAIDGVKGREWEERLRRYADSQLTVGDFCVWEGVSVAAFYVWRKKLGGGQRGRRTKGSAATAEGALGSIGPLSRESFLPVRVAERSVATAGVPAPPVNNPRRTRHGDTVPATSARIEVRLTNGVCIFVPCTEPNARDTSRSLGFSPGTNFSASLRFSVFFGGWGRAGMLGLPFGLGV